VKLGAEPKQVAIFAGLILVAAVLHFTGDDGRPESASRPATKTAAPAVSGSAGPRTTPVAAKAPRPGAGRRTSLEFKPVLRPRRVEDRVDPAGIDPTLRMDLLTRLAAVQVQGGQRPLFEFAAAPPPKAPDPGKIIPAKPVAPVKVAAVKPPGPATPLGVDASKPNAPPIPLKFYGFAAARAGVRRGFFLENEDVFIAAEGEIVKRRYKVVRINMNSVVMEDTQYQQQQTLPLTEQLQ
jgi:hypothetical protein